MAVFVFMVLILTSCIMYRKHMRNKWGRRTGVMVPPMVVHAGHRVDPSAIEGAVPVVGVPMVGVPMDPVMGVALAGQPINAVPVVATAVPVPIEAMPVPHAHGAVSR